MVLRILVSVMCGALWYPAIAGAQDNYEIQVYPSETMAPKTLLIELHSNFTVEGSTAVQFGMLPTQHQEHETIELTEGINEWSEAEAREPHCRARCWQIRCVEGKRTVRCS